MSINLQVSQGLFIDKNSSTPAVLKNDVQKVDEAKENDSIENTTKNTNEQTKRDSLEKKNIKLEEILATKLESKEEEQKLKDAMSTISEFLNIPIRSVNFAKHEGSDKTVIKIFDTENQELIKQFPSEEILSIAQRIVELQQDVGTKTGILLDENV
jgi:flagellar protein FlaG